MTENSTKIDWDAVTSRLASRTDDPAVIAGLERLRQSGDIDTAFGEWVIQTDASLDWIFFDRGLPFMSNASYVGRVVPA